MTKEEIAKEVRAAACKLVRQHGIPPSVACKMAARAALRAKGLPIPHGLGADTIPTSPGAPAILSNVAAAGDDPTVVAARNAVTKWSFLIPIGGLLMSAKSKIAAWRTPTSAAIVGSRRR